MTQLLRTMFHLPYLFGASEPPLLRKFTCSKASSTGALYQEPHRPNPLGFHTAFHGFSAREAFTEVTLQQYDPLSKQPTTQWPLRRNICQTSQVVMRGPSKNTNSGSLQGASLSPIGAPYPTPETAGSQHPNPLTLLEHRFSFPHQSHLKIYLSVFFPLLQWRNNIALGFAMLMEPVKDIMSCGCQPYPYFQPF